MHARSSTRAPAPPAHRRPRRRSPRAAANTARGSVTTRGTGATIDGSRLLRPRPGAPHGGRLLDGLDAGTLAHAARGYASDPPPAPRGSLVSARRGLHVEPSRTHAWMRCACEAASRRSSPGRDLLAAERDREAPSPSSGQPQLASRSRGSALRRAARSRGTRLTRLESPSMLHVTKGRRDRREFASERTLTESAPRGKLGVGSLDQVDRLAGAQQGRHPSCLQAQLGHGGVLPSAPCAAGRRGTGTRSGAHSASRSRPSSSVSSPRPSGSGRSGPSAEAPGRADRSPARSVSGSVQLTILPTRSSELVLPRAER